MLQSLGSFTSYARRIGPNATQRGQRQAPQQQQQPQGRSRRGSSNGPDPKVVREWAKSQSITVNERGRLSGEVVERYLAATG